MNSKGDVVAVPINLPRDTDKSEARDPERRKSGTEPQEDTDQQRKRPILVLLGGADWAVVRSAAANAFRCPVSDWTVFLLEEKPESQTAPSFTARDTATRAERAGASIVFGDFKALSARLSEASSIGKPSCHIVYDLGGLHGIQARLLKWRLSWAHPEIGLSMSGAAAPNLGDPRGDRAVGRSVLSQCAGTLGIVIAFGAANSFLFPFAGLAVASSMMLLSVVMAAVLFGRWAGIIAASLSVGVVNLVLVEPVWTFQISQTRDLVTLFVFMAVGGIMSVFVGRSNQRALIALDRQRLSSILFGYARQMAKANTTNEIEDILNEELGRGFGVRVAIILDLDDKEAIERSLRERDLPYIDADITAVLVAVTSRESAGFGTSNSNHGLNFYEPIPLEQGSGALVIAGATEHMLHQSGFRVLIETVSDIAAIAIARIAAHVAFENSHLETERERSRSAVLAAMSHDFRTPLSTILGSATSLREFKESYTEETVDELLGNIVTGAERLDRFVRKILDHTKLKTAGSLSEGRPIDLTDVVETAVDSVSQKLLNHTIKYDFPSVVPLVFGAPDLLEHLVQNLLENATKYSKAGTMISVRLAVSEDAVALEVSDQGIGMSPEQVARVFEESYQAHADGRRSDGIGLGLSICAEIARIHGATIEAKSDGPGHGSTFTVHLAIANVVEF